MEPSVLRTRYEGFRRRWRTLSFYERFEQVVALVLSWLIAALLITLLALARKLIILDLNEFSASTILALAAVMLALGITYWLVRDQDVEEAPMSG